MKAIVQDRYGSPDVLAVEDVPRPVPADNQVLVRVHAAAVNAYDWHVMRGDPYLARLMNPSVFGRRGPRKRIRGRDFAGRVEAVGKEVTRFRAGDDVYGDLGGDDGAFAAYVCAAEDLLEHKPANLTFEEAAALPLAGTTALKGLRDLGRLASGQRVLINGASGGVGTFAVQIARASGAEVTGVCSTRNTGLVRSIGADHVIDYTEEDFTRGGQRYDVVFDLVGNRTLTECRRVLGPTGTLVLSGGGVSDGGSLVGPMGLILAGQLLAPFVRGQRLRVLTTSPSRESLTALRELAESGAVTPVIDRTYPLGEVPEAIRYVEGEHARAKVVITC
ncbi:NAD(P)-dependent alcohol dehydrogenase [Streptomyces sp. TRM49041]|uniref:NAD(P)-dependent alcohol dehydrogenase n=1 Tax=Streptomyces sp. TRM49041 TaxID=2603216 RepID=UPI0011EBD48F|nr:NAD(P)-dependent alcohol dehydrogenase [Streptomyces sp. TRM49041]